MSSQAKPVPPTMGLPAAALSIPTHHQTLRRLIRDGKVKATRQTPTGRWMVPVSEVERLRSIILAGLA